MKKLRIESPPNTSWEWLRWSMTVALPTALLLVGFVRLADDPQLDEQLGTPPMEVEVREGEERWFDGCSASIGQERGRWVLRTCEPPPTDVCVDGVERRCA